jgi:hypothetical protein
VAAVPLVSAVVVVVDGVEAVVEAGHTCNLD